MDLWPSALEPHAGLCSTNVCNLSLGLTQYTCQAATRFSVMRVCLNMIRGVSHVIFTKPLFLETYFLLIYIISHCSTEDDPSLCCLIMTPQCVLLHRKAEAEGMIRKPNDTHLWEAPRSCFCPWAYFIFFFYLLVIGCAHIMSSPHYAPFHLAGM